MLVFYHLNFYDLPKCQLAFSTYTCCLHWIYLFFSWFKKFMNTLKNSFHPVMVSLLFIALLYSFKILVTFNLTYFRGMTTETQMPPTEWDSGACRCPGHLWLCKRGSDKYLMSSNCDLPEIFYYHSFNTVSEPLVCVFICQICITVISYWERLGVVSKGRTYGRYSKWSLILFFSLVSIFHYVLHVLYF